MSAREVCARVVFTAEMGCSVIEQSGAGFGGVGPIWSSKSDLVKCWFHYVLLGFPARVFGRSSAVPHNIPWSD